MRIVWLGCRNVFPLRDVADAIEGDARVSSFEELSLDVPSDAIDERTADCDGVMLAVHHFEPRTTRRFERLNASLDPQRWRAALGPFALVAGRAPFEALHRQGIVADGDPFAVRRWLDLLASGEKPSASTLPRRTLIWAPSEERCGVDPDLFRRRSADSTTGISQATLLTPRMSGLPFLPDLVVAWIPPDLNREERVHLGQLASAAPSAAKLAVYASPSARSRVRFPADATLVWPYDARSLLLAAEETVACRVAAPFADRAA
jgi:hypothetical protein